MSRIRLTPAAALAALRNAPLIDLMRDADSLRRELHPGDRVTFVIDTNPNYTNVCVTDCTFCSFYRKPGHAEGYTLSPREVAEKARYAQGLGATTVLLQGGHNPDLPFAYYLELIDAVQSLAPGMHRHFFSPPEIDHIARTCEMAPETVLQKFWAAGLRTMPGGGAEILSDPVRRRVSPKKISADRWIEIMRIAHGVGMKTSATMTYGHVESDADVIEHLFRLRALQDETGGFYAFIPWSFKPGASPLSKLVEDTASPSYYLRIIAVSRLVLDNIPHIQASWFGEGWRAGQLALHAGADDFGGLLIEENVLYQAKHTVATSMGGILRTIRDAGFTPAQRTTLYETLQVYAEPVAEESLEPPSIQRTPQPTVT